MDEATKEILIAEDRPDEMKFKPANVFVRSKLYDAIPNSDEGKLASYTNTNDFWLTQSGAVKAKEGIDETKKHFNDEMRSRPAMFGEGGTRKYQCPGMHIGYVNVLRQDCVTMELRSREEPPLFSSYNGLNIVWPLQATVTEALMKHKLIATKPMAHGCHYAEPIPLSSSMATFENEEWVKFDSLDM